MIVELLVFLVLAAVIVISFSSTRRSRQRRYPDAGVALTYKLISALNLTGWKDGIPEFTLLESEAIQSELSNFHQMANSETGGEVVFHPNVVDEIQRKSGADALKALADDEWKFSDTLPSAWREIVSTYLKAWAMGLNPIVLIELSDLLALASYKLEAKEAAEIVVNFFPDYAQRFFAGADVDNRVTNQLVVSAREAIQRL
jgi:hypothetical protein